jgi:polyisoprenoid-binding protein YceI
MKRTILIALVALAATGMTQAQKYFTREGHVSFHSDASLEKIEAHNKTATSVLDAATGKMEFAVLIKAFQFEKALMQEHFNENYMESDKFPKASFKGEIANASKVNFSKDGEYPVKVKGDMTIHGVTKPVEADGFIRVKSGKISAASSFNVAVADYNIEVPSVVRDNIAKEVRVDIDVNFEPFTK